jgi:Uma2 family endonuclease
MAETATRLMTPEEFFAWERGRDGLYELVDGVPVPHVKMMTGASVRHDGVVVNIIAALATKLRGGACRPTTDDIALRTKIRTIRRPDVTVDCGPLAPDAYESGEPKLVVEVLSPSTTDIDRFRKLEEYKLHPSLAYILLVETRAAKAILYRRVGGAWETEPYEGLDATIALPEIGADLTMAEIYEGLPLGDQ